MTINAAGSVTRASAAAPSHAISPLPEPSKRRASAVQESAFVSARPPAARQGQTNGSVVDVKL
jgi:hypothetical protein